MNSILNSVLGRIKPNDSEIIRMNALTAELKAKIEKGLKKSKINADVFIGGSLAKNTLIRKDVYDIDIFVRFAFKDYSAKDSMLSDILEKALKSQNLKSRRIHGSRDYFHVKAAGSIIFEIVPVLHVKKPQEAVNVTDLSSFHVSYVSKKINKKLADEIRLAKAFCYAQRCYGAESYIQGFSGYAVELLVLHFGSLMKLAKAALKWKDMLDKKEKIVIDSAKHYKNKNDVLININEAKLASPIILVDPTYSVRNATASVSIETLERFIEACVKLAGKANAGMFEKKEIDIAMLKKSAKKSKAELSILYAATGKSKDVAPAKLRKFLDFVLFVMQRHGFEVIRKEIDFAGKEARMHIIYKSPGKEMIAQGPPINRIDNLLAFRKKYKNISIKKGVAYARIKRKVRDIKAAADLIRKGSEIKAMDISEFKISK
ncbi:MAG: hypothetical protein V1886_01785 [archaeon]